MVYDATNIMASWIEHLLSKDNNTKNELQVFVMWFVNTLPVLLKLLVSQRLLYLLRLCKFDSKSANGKENIQCFYITSDAHCRLKGKNSVSTGRARKHM